MKLAAALVLVVTISLVNGAFKADPPYFAQRYAGQGGVRGLFVDPSGDLLSEARSEIQVYWEQPNEDGSVDIVQRMIINGQGLNLNHAVAFHNGYIYAGSPTAVYRWPYVPGSRELITAQPETVVNNIPSGGHDSRPIAFDSQGRLYVTVASLNNVDQNSERARIRRFELGGGGFPLNFQNGEVFADGLRNESGLTFYNGVLYGVENGADNLNRPDFGDIHNDNPAEELNRFDAAPGTHYGYPYCFSIHRLLSFPAGHQLAWPSFMDDGVHTDAFCQNPENNRPPLIPMQAHSAPLGVEFFAGQNCGNGVAFPCSYTGNAFVAQHGSWNRDQPAGYKVVMYPFIGNTPIGGEVTIAYDDAPPGNWRPVNAVFNQQGHLLVSADSQGFIVRVTFGQPAAPIRANIVLD